MKEVRLSIALVTRNRPDLLETCLNSLFQNTPMWYEIIISDDSSMEELIIKNKNIAKKYDVIYLEGPKKGLYVNRNFIAKKCQGTHIRTMDDDHTFPKDHFEICIKKIKEDPNSIWIIGEYLPSEKILNSPHPSPSELHPRGFSVIPKDTQNSRAISCGASIYPRKVIDLDILNIEDFKFGSNYLEYGARLKHLGFRIRHLSDTYVIHNFDINTRSFNNEEEILDSNLYAIMSLSFVYEPTIKNKLLTSFRILYLLLAHYKVSRTLLLRNIGRVKQLKKNLNLTH